MTPYLTDDEVAHITHPRTQGAARIRYFREVLKVKCEPRPNGQPLVWRADFDAVRRQQGQAANDGRPTSRDWTAFEERVGSRGGEKKEGRQPARARAAG